MAKRAGLAFSGGGLRSAAFCSGVLRRVLQQSLPIEYLSSVSGGGYTASAYLDWKFRHDQQDNQKWHKIFFEHMRKHSGFYVNWNNPLYGCADLFILVFVVITVSIVLPIVNWFPFAMPMAVIIDLCFGNILRADFQCRRNKTNNSPSTGGTCSPVNLVIPMEKTEVLFAVLIFTFLVLSIFNYISGTRYKTFCRVLGNAFGFAFLMVFLPWFIEQYLYVTALWVNGLVFALSVVIWLGFPPLRDKAALALIVYFYAYVVKWKIFKTPVLSIQYTITTFAIALWISAILIFLGPILGLIQQGALNTFNRYVVLNYI